MNKVNYQRNVFINCPFDPAYDPFLNALIFTIFACGYLQNVPKKLAMMAKLELMK